MFHIFPSPKERPLYDESGLKKVKSNHDYWRTKRVVDAVALVFTAFLIITFVAIVVEYVSNQVFHDYAIDLLKQNLTGIVLWVLTILGIKFSSKK